MINLNIETCRTCGGEGRQEMMVPFDGAWFHEECKLEDDAFREREINMENEMLIHRRKNPNFYIDLAVEKDRRQKTGLQN